jgi:hypothetical protein
VFFKNKKGKPEEVLRKAVKDSQERMRDSLDRVFRRRCSCGSGGPGQRRPEAPHQQLRRCTNTYCRYRLPTTKKQVVPIRFVWEYKFLLAVQLCCPASQVFEAERRERVRMCGEGWAAHGKKAEPPVPGSVDRTTIACAHERSPTRHLRAPLSHVAMPALQLHLPEYLSLSPPFCVCVCA